MKYLLLLAISILAACGCPEYKFTKKVFETPQGVDVVPSSKGVHREQVNVALSLIAVDLVKTWPETYTSIDWTIKHLFEDTSLVIFFSNDMFACQSDTGKCRGIFIDQYEIVRVANIDKYCLSNTAFVHEVLHAVTKYISTDNTVINGHPDEFFDEDGDSVVARVNRKLNATYCHWICRDGDILVSL